MIQYSLCQYRVECREEAGAGAIETSWSHPAVTRLYLSFKTGTSVAVLQREVNLSTLLTFGVYKRTTGEFRGVQVLLATWNNLERLRKSQGWSRLRYIVGQGCIDCFSLVLVFFLAVMSIFDRFFPQMFLKSDFALSQLTYVPSLLQNLWFQIHIDIRIHAAT